jgi:hypothetical protein
VSAAAAPSVRPAPNATTSRAAFSLAAATPVKRTAIRDTSVLATPWRAIRARVVSRVAMVRVWAPSLAVRAGRRPIVSRSWPKLRVRVTFLLRRPTRSKVTRRKVSRPECLMTAGVASTGSIEPPAIRNDRPRWPETLMPACSSAAAVARASRSVVLPPLPSGTVSGPWAGAD